MNKKIKVIELLNRMNENENIPKKIKYNDIEYTYDENMQEYCACNEGRTIYFFYNVVKHKWAWLGTEVEILEDEEEIDIKMFEQEWFEYYEGIISVVDVDLAVKMNEIVDKLNKLDKKINKEE